MNIEQIQNISVIGAGAWGTALAQTLASTDKQVTLWTRAKSHADEINSYNENKKYLEGFSLNHNIKATSETKTALQNNVLLMVTPTQTYRYTLKSFGERLTNDHILILCSKGVEHGTASLLSEITEQEKPNLRYAILSGPNFAIDVVAGKPAGTTLACKDMKLSEALQNLIAAPYFRPYITDDVIGTQIAGAIKNVIAIACGIANGMNMGDSARASLVTRGLAEIARLGEAMGAQKETFLGMCGIGDMMLTCSSETSRNFSLGVALGHGNTLQDILKSRKTVTEGVHTAQSAMLLSERYNVDMPICDSINQCLNHDMPLKDVLENMLNRPLKPEYEAP